MNTLKLATSYDDFDTEAYYKKFRVPLRSDGTVQYYLKFIVDSLHEVFSSGSISGDRLLDVGTGVSLMSFLSASRFVKEIHLSDILPKHLDLLQRWLEGEERDKEQDIIEYIVGRENNGTSCKDRLTEVRSKVTQIKYIDVTACPPLRDFDEKYDVITSTFCLEVATRSVIEFTTAVKNIAYLVKHRGHLILVATLEESFYVVDNVKYWNACVTEGDVRSALGAVGFTIVTVRSLKKNTNLFDDNYAINFRSVCLIVAQKTYCKKAKQQPSA